MAAIISAFLEVSFDDCHLVCDMSEAHDRPGSSFRECIKRGSFHLNGCDSLLFVEEAVKLAVRDGLGISFISKFSVATELKAETLFSPKLKGVKIYRELKIIYRKGRHLSRAENVLIEMSQRLQ